MTVFSVVQPALPRMVPSRHNLQHVCITLAHSVRTWPPLFYLHLAKSLSQQLGKWQTCQQSPQLQSLEKVAFSDLAYLFIATWPGSAKYRPELQRIRNTGRTCAVLALMEEDACVAFGALAMPACCTCDCSYSSQQPPKECCFGLRVHFAPGNLSRDLPEIQTSACMMLLCRCAFA